MKLKNLFIALAASVALYSCGGKSETATTPVDSTAAVTYNVTLDSSSVAWKGTMVNVYSHNGTVKLTQGTLTVAGGAVTAGSFTVDLKSITPLDSNYAKDRPKENLIGHLGAADFFAVDSFPTASFVIKKVEGNTATGDLTVRGKTNEEKVTDIVVTADSSSVSATGKLVFNRQKYNVAYKATMKDMVLSDDIELTISLKGTK